MQNGIIQLSKIKYSVNSSLIKLCNSSGHFWYIFQILLDDALAKQIWYNVVERLHDDMHYVCILPLGQFISIDYHTSSTVKICYNSVIVLSCTVECHECGECVGSMPPRYKWRCWQSTVFCTISRSPCRIGIWFTLYGIYESRMIEWIFSVATYLFIMTRSPYWCS